MANLDGFKSTSQELPQREWVSSARTIVNRVSLLIALAAILGTVIIALWVANVTRDNSRDEVTRRNELVLDVAQKARDLISADMKRLEENNRILRQTLETFSSTKGTKRYSRLNPADRLIVNRLKADQISLQQRLESIEQAVMSTPEKALNIPILKQQINSLEERLRRDSESTQQEVNRLYTLTQWFIGLMFTISLGLIGIVISNNLPRKS